jgi:hypothetical protein
MYLGHIKRESTVKMPAAAGSQPPFSLMRTAAP